MARHWEFLFNRRRWTLDNYLSDCVTVEDAKAKFQNEGMIPPTDQILVDHGMQTSDPNMKPTKELHLRGVFSYPKDTTPSTSDSKTKESSKKQKVKPKPSKKETNDEESGKYDDIIVLDT